MAKRILIAVAAVAAIVVGLFTWFISNLPAF